MNIMLSQRFMTIDDLSDVSDGLMLLHVLEILVQKKLFKNKKAPKMKIHKLQNVNVALDFLEADGVRTFGLNAHAVVDGNKRVILGLVWTLISQYQIQRYATPGVTGKKALLNWVKEKVEVYNVSVRDFSKSFADGRALCALVYALDPVLIDMEAIDAMSAEQRLRLAFDTAESDLSVPAILDVADLISGKPDEQSVMTYVSFFRIKWDRPKMTAEEIEEREAAVAAGPRRAAPRAQIRRELESDTTIAAAAETASKSLDDGTLRRRKKAEESEAAIREREAAAVEARRKAEQEEEDRLRAQETAAAEAARAAAEAEAARLAEEAAKAAAATDAELAAKAAREAEEAEYAAERRAAEAAAAAADKQPATCVRCESEPPESARTCGRWLCSRCAEAVEGGAPADLDDAGKAAEVAQSEEKWLAPVAEARITNRKSVLVRVAAKPAEAAPSSPELASKKVRDSNLEAKVASTKKVQDIPRTKTLEQVKPEDLMAAVDELLAANPAFVSKASRQSNRMSRVSFRGPADLDNEPWWFGDVTRNGAELLLADRPPGTFVVRPSSQPNCLALTFKKPDQTVGHGLLEFDQAANGWRIESEPAVHSTLDSLLRSYPGLQHSAKSVPTDLLQDLTVQRQLSEKTATMRRAKRVKEDKAVRRDQADLSRRFAHDEPPQAPGPDADDATRRTWKTYQRFLGAQELSLEDYAARYRGLDRDSAAKVAKESEMRVYASIGSEDAAAGPVSIEVVVDSLEDGTTEIEVPMRDMVHYVAIADYTPSSPSELAFAEGDEVVVLGADGEPWWKAEKDGVFGWVPAAYLNPVSVGVKTRSSAVEAITEEDELEEAIAKENELRAQAPVPAVSEESKKANRMSQEPGAKVMYAQAIEDFDGEAEGELTFRRDDYVCVLGGEDDGSGWWKGQLPTGEFGWVPAEFLEILPGKPEDYENRKPSSRNRLVLEYEKLVDKQLNEDADVEAMKRFDGQLQCGWLYLQDLNKDPGNEWHRRFVVLTKEKTLEVYDAPSSDSPLDKRDMKVSVCATHSKRQFAFFIRNATGVLLLAPLKTDATGRSDRDDWVKAIEGVIESKYSAKDAAETKAPAAISKTVPQTKPSQVDVVTAKVTPVVEQPVGKDREGELGLKGALGYSKKAAKLSASFFSVGNKTLQLKDATIASDAKLSKNNAFSVTSGKQTIIVKCANKADFDAWYADVKGNITLAS